MTDDKKDAKKDDAKPDEPETDDGIISIEEVLEDVADAVKAPFQWLLGKPRK